MHDPSNSETDPSVKQSATKGSVAMNRISWICLVRLISLLAIVGLLTIHSGVLVAAEEGTSSQQEEAQWQIGRKPCPKVRLAEQCALIAGNTEFAFDLFQTLWNPEDNLFFSPYSISLCLVMMYGGARGTTEEQMASALHFMLSQERLHIAFNALDLELARRGERLAVTEDEKFQLHLANSLWLESEYKLLESFRKLLVVNYGAATEPLDFADAPEASRQTINKWVSQETEKKIRELLPEGSITSLTRLVLANAITFNATWKHRFNEAFTHNSPFYLLDDRQVAVPMMHQITPFAYTATSGVQAVELPYIGDEFSMVILLPAPGQFETFAKLLTADRVISILGHLSKEMVQVYMPRFEFRSSFRLSSALKDLGMTDAFILGQADFTGMTKSRELFLDDVYHQSIVSVDENGTFAAVGSAADMPMPIVPTVKLNRPFIFLIRDIKTGTVLFIGQVMDPSVR
jgi:serpin B